jgi:hypothetical protein
MSATASTTFRTTVQAAFFAALNVSAITSTLSCGVYGADQSTQNARFPFLRISTPSGIGWPTVGRAGRRRIVQVSVFSQDQSGSQANAILDKVMELRPYQTVTTEDEIQDGDGAEEVINNVRTFHKWVQFPVHLQESS